MLLEEFCTTALAKADVIATPGMPFAVPRVDETDVGGSPALADMVARISWCTRVANYLGTPALAVPCGFTANRLPTAVQFMGRPFSEPLLYQVGAALERACGFREHRPPII